MSHGESLPIVVALGIGAVFLLVFIVPTFSTGAFLLPFQQPQESEFQRCSEAILGKQFGAEGVTAKVPYRVQLNWETFKSASPVTTDGRFTITFSDWKSGERIPSDVVYDFIFKGQSDVRELRDRVARGGLDTFEVNDILHPCSLNYLIHIDAVGDTVLFDPTSDPEYNVETNGNMSPIGIQFQVIQTPTGMFGMNTITWHVAEVVIPEGASLPDSRRTFEPQTVKVTIGVNNTVRWINQDKTLHWIEADNQSDPAFYNATSDENRKLIAPNESFVCNAS